MSRIFVFPGQGSQVVGMGRDLAKSFPEARAVFDEVDDALGQKLFQLMTEGTEAELNLTENTQPALMAVSIAVFRVLLQQSGRTLPELCSYVAGHSLGEYSALTAAGALALSDTARLLKIRGRAMQAAVPVGIGAMAAILGLDLPDVQKIMDQVQDQVGMGEVIQVANDNSSGQVVVSGHVNAVNAACALATTQGAKRAVLLPVSAPFHCKLMQSAADQMRIALSDITIHDLSVPVIANVTAAPEVKSAAIPDLLVNQVTGMVRWRESVQTMRKLGITQAFELGSGKVLSGLIKRIEPDITLMNAGNPDEIDTLLKAVI